MKKFSILFSFILFFVIFSTSSVFAFDNPDDGVYHFKDNIYPNISGIPSSSNFVFKPLVFDNVDNTYCLLFIGGYGEEQFNSDFNITIGDDGVFHVTNSGVADYAIKYRTFKLNNTTWNSVSGSSATPISVETGANFAFSPELEVLYSEFNIYNEDGTVFFPVPPSTPMTVEMMVAMETPVMAEKITQAMMIILLCGVGCLALVIGLNLFGKVFRIFQVK